MGSNQESSASSPEVSVVLPFFNSEQTLANAIKSILEQSFENFQLVLIDNNSKDESFNIAQHYGQKDPRIQIVKEEKQGVSYAMNTGIRLSRGKYIARMDSDDISLPDRLTKQVQFLNEHPEIDLIGSNVLYVTHQKNTEGFKQFVDWSNSFHNPEEIVLNQFIEIPVVNPTIMFRRELSERFGGCLHGDFPEDYEMLLRYLSGNARIQKLNEVLLEWHDYSGRLTRTDERYSTEAFFRTKARYFAPWSEKNNPNHPHIWIWGAGRKTRQRAKILEKEGLKIGAYIDIIEGKTTAKRTIYYKDIPDPGEVFIVPMVSKRGARKKIKDFLLSRNYTEGKDFMLLS